MISRRNIRVKVMQTLYNVNTLESDIKPGEPQKILQNHFDQTRQLFVHLTYFLTEVCRYAETDAHQKAGKHLPSYEDLHVNTKLAGNKILWRIVDDSTLKNALEKLKPSRRSVKNWYEKYTCVSLKPRNTNHISIN